VVAVAIGRRLLVNVGRTERGVGDGCSQARLATGSYKLGEDTAKKKAAERGLGTAPGTPGDHVDVTWSYSNNCTI